MKKIILPILILSVILMSFTYNVFSYKVIKVIDSSPQQFTKNVNYKSNNLESIMTFCLNQTKNDLEFSLSSKQNNSVPYISKSKQANCIGYTNYYNSMLSKCLSENNIDYVEITHVRALVFMDGINMHQFSNDPSFKDHDISIVKNKKTGEVYYVDASLSEMFGNIIVK